MKIEILIDKIKDREDSFWYIGDDIARVQFINGKKLYVETQGEIQVFFEPDGEIFKGQDAIDEAERRNYTDKDLSKLLLHDGWKMNNWFGFVLIDIDGNGIDYDFDVAGDYDEAIKMLGEIAKEEFKKMYT